MRLRFVAVKGTRSPDVRRVLKKYSDQYSEEPQKSG